VLKRKAQGTIYIQILVYRWGEERSLFCKKAPQKTSTRQRESKAKGSAKEKDVKNERAHF